MKNSFLVIFLVLTGWSSSYGQPLSDKDRLDWFRDAKLGIFIHWGYYGVNGISESWSMYHKKIGYQDYLDQGKMFSAENYHPEDWARLFKRIGARYAVLITKHHDGIALWDTDLSKLDTRDHSAARRDLVQPFVDAVRNQGLKVGLYYSLCDWSHPDYTPVVFERPNTSKYYLQRGQSKMEPWQRFTKFNFGQLKELNVNFRPDLMWFDGDWEHKEDEWNSAGIKDSLLQWNPDVIVNSRLNQYGDYLTPEQGVPVVRPQGMWEFCMTMNDNWGFYPSDLNYKPVAQIIRTFVEVISMGGNLLLNIGPQPDGSIPAEQLERLERLGDWINKHETAVFDTQAGLPSGHFYGPTLIGKDNRKIYLCLFDQPKNYIQLKGIQNNVRSVTVLGTGEKLGFVRNGGASWNRIPGIIRIDLPGTESLDPYVTVLEIELEEELELYRGHGNAVEMNN